MNIRRAHELLESLYTQGVREFCICAGSRNSPLVAVLEQTQNIRRYSFFEERSAAFFALGRIKLTGQPVAVVTTSGTAAAELLPATIEAHYSSLPLVLVTADRPPAFRTTGSPQTIEQIGLFSHYVGATFDLSGDLRETGHATLQPLLQKNQPVHVNICFDEPLLDEPVQSFELQHKSEIHSLSPGSTPGGHRSSTGDSISPRVLQTLARMSKPLIILGRLSGRHREQVENILTSLRIPIWAEALSGLRESRRLSDRILRSGEQILTTRVGQEIDGVIRIGSVPTLRFWRDLEKRTLPIMSFSAEPFAGLARGELIYDENITSQLHLLTNLQLNKEHGVDLLALDRSQHVKLEAILANEPLSEVGWFRWISEHAQPEAHIYIGNSLPIREWDLAASRDERRFRVEANRGANGIDGQISTFFGTCANGNENWGIFGDLTTLYDLSAPWILSQLPNLNWRLVVINNFGGQIFSRLFRNSAQSPTPNRAFLNAHGIQFAHWSKMWNLPYENWLQRPSGTIATNSIIEIQPDAKSSERFWQACEAIWKNQ